MNKGVRSVERRPRETVSHVHHAATESDKVRPAMQEMPGLGHTEKPSTARIESVFIKK